MRAEAFVELWHSMRGTSVESRMELGVDVQRFIVRNIRYFNIIAFDSKLDFIDVITIITE